MAGLSSTRSELTLPECVSKNPIRQANDAIRRIPSVESACFGEGICLMKAVDQSAKDSPRFSASYGGIINVILGTRPDVSRSSRVVSSLCLACFLLSVGLDYPSLPSRTVFLSFFSDWLDCDAMKPQSWTFRTGHACDVTL